MTGTTRGRGDTETPGHGDTRRQRPGRAATAPDGIRLVALDMDGTILERGRHILPELVAALRRLAESGVYWTTATGRPLGFQLELFAQFGLGAAAGLPHALMADERELFVLDGRDDRDTASGSGRRAPARYIPLRPWNDDVRARWRDLHRPAMTWLELAQAEAQRRGWKAVPHLPEADAYARGLPTLQLEGPEQAAALRLWLAERLEQTDEPLACNRNVRLLQIVDATVGKGLVLLELARAWGLQPSQVLAVGDSANDFTMLDGRHGLRCATVSNADPAIKDVVQRAGGYVATQPIGAGVLEVLRRHFPDRVSSPEGA